jgi:hypothetical protein
MASILGHSTSNRPLLGFVKRHRAEDPRIQRELNIALGDHAREGNERGVALCLWAGADPHAPALSLNLEIAENADSEDDEEPFLGWSAITEAARAGHLGILKRACDLLHGFVRHAAEPRLHFEDDVHHAGPVVPEPLADLVGNLRHGLFQFRLPRMD